MPQDSTSASSSQIKVEDAADDVVNVDSRIERKKPIVGGEDEISQSNLAASIILSNAVNEIFGNDENKAFEDKNPRSRSNYSRNLIYLAFGFVFAGFLWSLYSILFEKNEVDKQSTREVYQYAIKLEDAVKGNSQEQMEQLANLVVQDNEWNQDRIRLFMKHWDNTDEIDKLKIKGQAWFNHFVYRLEGEVNYRKQIGQIKVGDKLLVHSPLVELSFALGLKDLFDTKRVVSVASVGDSQEAKSSSNVVASVDAKKISQQNSSNSNPVTQELILAEKDLSNQPGMPSTKLSEQLVDPQQSDRTNSALSTEKIPPRLSISRKDITAVLELYKAAYESGSMQDMASLFGVNQPNAGEQIVEELKRNFENIFNSSIRRQIDFNSVNWRSQGNQVTVDSQYYASIELHDNNGIQYTNGNARINLHRVGNKLVIKNFESISPANKKIKPDLSLSSIKEEVQNKNMKLTSDDLRKVVGRFIQAYEAGDLDRIANLLAKNAKSNDKINREGITKDYKDLFEISSHRRILIRNMQWDNQGETAKGTGDVEAFVYKGEDQTPYTMRGKIQIVAKKREGKVVITHLYHLERSN